MPGLGHILSRTFFWSYERGTWQYDLAVILILVFVLLTPSSWFHDQPQVGTPPGPSQVQQLSEEDATASYQVDARILASPEQTPQLQNDLHTALQKALPELRAVRFEITHIESVRDDRGTVIAYRVAIRRK